MTVQLVLSAGVLALCLVQILLIGTVRKSGVVKSPLILSCAKSVLKAEKSAAFCNYSLS